MSYVFILNFEIIFFIVLRKKKQKLICILICTLKNKLLGILHRLFNAGERSSQLFPLMHSHVYINVFIFHEDNLANREFTGILHLDPKGKVSFKGTGVPYKMAAILKCNLQIQLLSHFKSQKLTNDHFWVAKTKKSIIYSSM